MKKLIFTVLINVCFCFVAQAQSDTTYLQQVNDSVYTKVFIQYDDQGREIASERIYYDSTSFYNFIFDLVVKTDRAFTRSENKLTEAIKNEKKKKKEFNQMKTFYSSFTSFTYTTVLDSVLKSQLSGDWRLVANDTTFNITLTSNLNKFKDIDTNKKMRVKYFQVGKLDLTVSADTPFFNEDVILIEEKDNQGRRMYRGKLADGSKVILKR